MVYYRFMDNADIWVEEIKSRIIHRFFLLAGYYFQNYTFLSVILLLLFINVFIGLLLLHNSMRKMQRDFKKLEEKWEEEKEPG